MKRFIASVLVLLLLCLAGLACAEQASPCVSGNWKYILEEDGSASITRYLGLDAEVTVPTDLDGHPVNAILDGAFNSNTGLTAITIPDSVTFIGSNPWQWCDSLKTIRLSPAHPTLTVTDGALYSRTGRRLIWCSTAREGAFAVPEGTRIIGENAFFQCRHLTSVTLPDSVTEIRANPWRFCRNLTQVLVSPFHPVLTTSDRVLYSKADLQLIWCPADYAGALRIPEGTKFIGTAAFASCTGLTSVTIPDSVTALYSSAFNWCTALTSVTLPEGLTYIGAEAFAYCENLSGVTIPSAVTHIGEDAFSGCEGLQSIVIPDSVTVLENGVFNECTGLSSVTLPDTLTSIGSWAFDGCTALTAVTVPRGVTFIGDDAFYWCENLASVTLPDTVTFIGEDAFGECPMLTLTVPEGSAAEEYCIAEGLPFVHPGSTAE